MGCRSGKARWKTKMKNISVNDQYFAATAEAKSNLWFRPNRRIETFSLFVVCRSGNLD